MARLWLWIKAHELIDALALLAFALIVAIFVLSLTRTPTAKPAPSPQQQVVNNAPVSPATKQQDSLPCPPPPGQGKLGACTPKPVQVFGGKAAPKLAPATIDPPASIPDVSSWQGVVDWGAVKNWQVSHGYKPFGIFKMGEYVTDPYAARNNDQLRSLGMGRIGYWFLRNTGCSYEAGQIINEARALGLKVIDLDDETPEAAGYDGCLTPTIRAAGFIVTEYASPGAYPGGAFLPNNYAWMAAYGPSSPPPAPWGGPIKAWQCTDGVYGCVTYVPGIGYDDVSVDYGITSLGSTPTDPNYNPSFNLGYADGVGGAYKVGYNVDHHPSKVESSAFNTGFHSGYSSAHAAGHAARLTVPRPTTFNTSFSWGFDEGWAAGEHGAYRVGFGDLYATPSSAVGARDGYQLAYPKAYKQRFNAGYLAGKR